MKYKIASWVIIAVLAILYFEFTTLWFPTQYEKIEKLAGSEIVFLDTELSYSHTLVVDNFKKMGIEGREINMYISGVLDMLFPIVYGLLFFLLLTKLTTSFTTPKAKLLWGLPLLGVLFDYAENFSVLGLLKQFPDITEQQVSLSSAFTSGKWVFVLLTVVSILGLAIFQLIRKVRGASTKL